MLRMTLMELAAFALPFLLYFIWRNSRWSTDAADNDRPAFPIVPVAAAGLVVSLIVLTILVFLDDSSSGDGVYIPPHIEDGQIIPGRFEPADPAELEPTGEPGTTDEDDPAEEADTPQ